MPLHLLPNLLDSTLNPVQHLGADVIQAVALLDGVFVENEKSARHYLKQFSLKKKLQEMPLVLLGAEVSLSAVKKGEHWGVLSEAGLPCIADPGASLVAKAREQQIPIKAYAGPSSILMGLILSGLPGQRFCFHGYIPKHPEERIKELKDWEMRSKREDETQIFIETPYRNVHTLRSCIENLQSDTRLCFAYALTSEQEYVMTTSIAKWRSIETPELAKGPAIYFFHKQ